MTHRGGIIIPVMMILHTGTGIAVEVNTEAVTHLRNPEPSNPSFAKGLNCMVNLSDGKFVTVIETCQEVRRLMQDRKSRK